jgi:hypothetical protein
MSNKSCSKTEVLEQLLLQRFIPANISLRIFIFSIIRVGAETEVSASA